MRASRSKKISWDVRAALSPETKTTNTLTNIRSNFGYYLRIVVST